MSEGRGEVVGEESAKRNRRGREAGPDVWPCGGREAVRQSEVKREK